MKNEHGVFVESTNSRWMLHPGCGEDLNCEYHKVVLDGQTFESMQTGIYWLVGFDPDDYHPYIGVSYFNA